VEEYVAKFPELGPIDKVPPQIIVEECRCRAKAGERYDAERYRDRFPVQYPLIRKELAEIRPSTVRDGGSGTVAGSVPAPGSSPVLPSNADQYEMVRLLGRGVFGEVWLARKKTSGIEKAIKIVTQPAEKEAAQRERRALELIKNLRHPYLLATEDFWVYDHRLHIVMELADCTLRNRLEQCREAGHAGIPEGELIGYIREAAEGLDFLHGKHVVHRDVKPDNILLLHGHAKVADFGLAWQQEKTMGAMKTFAGTPAYMAPEIWGKEGGPPSDLYALAVSYVELRQGRPPLQSQPIHEMMFAHLEGVHDFEPFVGEGERGVIEKALARAPEDRYRSCREFVEELSLALGVSMIPRSGVVTQPPSRAVSSPSSWKAGSVAASTAAATRADPALQTHPGGGSGTLTDPPLPAFPSASPRRARRPMAAAIAGLVTLVLLGALGAAIWALFFHDWGERAKGTGDTGNSPPTNPLPTPKTTESNNGSNAEHNGHKDPVTPAIVLPPNTIPDPKGKVVKLADGRSVYDWVIAKVGQHEVRFHLIAPSSGPKIAPFYIMESKVWNALYRDAGPIRPDSEKNGPDAPVTFVTVQEAANFAATAFGKAFRLPSPEEFDQAAGLYSVKDRDDVTRPGGQPRVRIAKPEPTHGLSARVDVNDFDLLDMAGNGREFTRRILTKPGEPVREVVEGTAPSPTTTDAVILRGRNFTLATGLVFSTLKYEQLTPQRQFAAARSAYTSFRVVVPLP
jgi:serine/threonine protein kinase